MLKTMLIVSEMMLFGNLPDFYVFALKYNDSLLPFNGQHVISFKTLDILFVEEEQFPQFFGFRKLGVRQNYFDCVRRHRGVRNAGKKSHAVSVIVQTFHAAEEGVLCAVSAVDKLVV